MASNSFGKIFRITTWGESHGKAIGVIIDGCPANVFLDVSMIQKELDRRSPGKNPWTSLRKETDQVEILSGTYQGKTTGAPISLLIKNQDAKARDYTPFMHSIRPGHANYTYLKKYGLFDPFGGGRASARETAVRVAAGAIAKQILALINVHAFAYVSQVGELLLENHPLEGDLQEKKALSRKHPLRLGSLSKELEVQKLLTKVIEEKDSVGAKIAFIAQNLPPGLGDPVYEKLSARLAYAMMSIPAAKAFSLGEGADSVTFSGSMHNDAMQIVDEKESFLSNHSGGVLGGISNGDVLYGHVCFKPTSSIKKKQQTIDYQKKENQTWTLPKTARHDPCVGIRASVVVEAMLHLVLVDAYFMNQMATCPSLPFNQVPSL